MGDIADRFKDIKDGLLPEFNPDGSLDLEYIQDTLATLLAYKEYLLKTNQHSYLTDKIQYLANAYTYLYQLSMLSDSEFEKDRMADDLFSRIMSDLLHMRLVPEENTAFDNLYGINSKYEYAYAGIINAVRDKNFGKAYDSFARFVALGSIGLLDSIRYNPDVSQGGIDEGIFEPIYQEKHDSVKRGMLRYANQHGLHPRGQPTLKAVGVDVLDTRKANYFKLKKV